jgi:hypothetical protein
VLKDYPQLADSLLEVAKKRQMVPESQQAAAT